MTKLFSDKTLEDQENSLALFMPEGDIFASKNEETSVFRKFIQGLSGELKRVYDGMNDLSEDYDINLTTELITNWESAVGIPDDCFPGTGDIATRRTHVLLKFAKMNVQTTDDFVNLAVSLGFTDVQIFQLQENALPPYDVPFNPTVGPGSRFIISVIGTDVISDIPPYDVPFTPSSNNSSILACVFDSVKPANVQVIFANL